MNESGDVATVCGLRCLFLRPESKARDARDAGKLVELFKDRLGPGSSSASGGSGAASGSSSTSQSGVASRIGTSHASTADATMGAADRPVMGQKERMEVWKQAALAMPLSPSLLAVVRCFCQQKSD